MILTILTLGHYYRNKREEHIISYYEWQKSGDYEVWPENIRFAAANLDVDYLKACFERLRGEVMQSDCKIVISTRLNNLFDKKVFLQLIDHIGGCLWTVRNK